MPITSYNLALHVITTDTMLLHHIDHLHSCYTNACASWHCWCAEESGAAHAAKSSSGGSQVFEARALASTGYTLAAAKFFA